MKTKNTVNSSQQKLYMRFAYAVWLIIITHDFNVGE